MRTNDESVARCVIWCSRWSFQVPRPEAQVVCKHSKCCRDVSATHRHGQSRMLRVQVVGLLQHELCIGLCSFFAFLEGDVLVKLVAAVVVDRLELSRD